MRPLDDDRLRHLRTVAATSDELPVEVGDGRYELIEPIDRGGMGLIVRARDHRLERDVALKILAPEAYDAAMARRMEREARILGALEHPGILPIHDSGHLEDGRVWMAMKYVRGERLDAHAARLASRRERVRLFLRVCEPVAFAHERGFVHRDLKPANVMVGSFGEVLVMDWGIARASEEIAPETSDERDPPDDLAPQISNDDTVAGTRLGTPGWMAPEQERGERADERADVYALGRILTMLAAPAEDPATEIPRPLAAIVARAIAAQPEQRYADVSALAADVTRWLDDEAPLAYRESLVEKANRLLQRHRVAIVLVLGYVIMRWLVYGLART